MTVWTRACQAPLSMGFSWQEYWSRLPCPTQGIFLTQGLNSHLIYVYVCHIYTYIYMNHRYISECVYMCVCVCVCVCMNHFAIHLKLTQHCKSTILQFKKRHIYKKDTFINTLPHSSLVGEHSPATYSHDFQVAHNFCSVHSILLPTCMSRIPCPLPL